MDHHITFQDPYHELSAEQRHRTTIDISGEDKAFLASVHSRRGTLQTTIGILLVKLINALKENGITSYDPDRFERSVTGANLLLGGTTPNPVAVETARGNDGPRTPPVAREPETPPTTAKHTPVPPSARRQENGRSKKIRKS